MQLAAEDADGIHSVSLADKTKGRKVIIFAVPGAFTPTCSSNMCKFYQQKCVCSQGRGRHCISVNDPHVMHAWGEATGTEAGITMLADAESAFTKAIGMDFTAAVGLLPRKTVCNVCH